MKCFVILFLSLYMCCFSSVDAASYQNEPEGFRNMKWGDSSKIFKSHHIVLQKDKMAAEEALGFCGYDSLNEDMRFQGEMLDRIIYYFRNEKLLGVELSFKGNLDDIYFRLCKFLVRQYNMQTEASSLLQFEYEKGDVTSIFLSKGKSSISLIFFDTKAGEKMNQDAAKEIRRNFQTEECSGVVHFPMF